MSRSNHPTLPAALDFTRRDFLKAGAALSALPIIGAATPAFAAGSDRIKIGLVGCGGRGIEAVRNCLSADPGVQLVALGDAFPDRVEAAMKEFKEGAAGKIRSGRCQPTSSP
jgi:hypothetical protein